MKKVDSSVKTEDKYGRRLNRGDVVIVSTGGRNYSEFGVFSHATEKRLMIRMAGVSGNYWSQKVPSTLLKFEASDAERVKSLLLSDLPD